MEVILVLGIIVGLIILIVRVNRSRPGLSEELAHQLFVLTQEIKELRKQVEKLQPSKESQSIVTETPKAPEPIIVPVKPAEPVKPAAPQFTTITPAPFTPLIPKEEKPVSPIPAFTKQNEPAPEPAESWWHQWLSNNPDIEKFIGENLINKIGIAILVLGIGFFVKYAIDKDWIHESGRVLIGLLCGGLLIGIAHRLRNSYRSFSSVLVGGGLSVFYFTIAFAFHEYHLIAQVPAFIIMIVITAFAVLLSLLYNRMELAILATIGGFITPFLVSTGQNNFVSLFTYLAVLNTGLLTLAYFKKWNPLNFIAFGFTILIYGGWLINELSGLGEVHYGKGILFASLFYLQFVMMQTINNLKLKKEFTNYDFSMLLAINVFFFAAGMLLLPYWDNGAYKGLFTAALSIINFIPAWYFFRRQADKKFVYLLIGLTLTFLSLTAPIQLDGNYITLFWSAECVLLLWFYQQSGIKLAKLASVLVGILATISLIMDWEGIYGTYDPHAFVLLNKAIITSSALAIAIILYRRLAIKRNEDPFLQLVPLSFVKNVLLTAFLLLILTSGILEIQYQFPYYYPDSLITTTYLQLWIFGYFSLLLILLPVLKIQLPLFVRMGIPVFLFIIYLLWTGDSYDGFIDMLQGKIPVAVFATHWIAIACLLFIIGISIQYFRENQELFPAFIKSFTWLAALSLVVILSIEVQHIYVGLNFTNIDGLAYSENLYSKAGLSIVWGLTSFVFIWLGMKYKHQTLRIVALVLFGVTLLKLFLYDIRNIPPGGKIAAFILLGVVLLTVSFMYQRLKKILIDDSKNNQ